MAAHSKVLLIPLCCIIACLAVQDLSTHPKVLHYWKPSADQYFLNNIKCSLTGDEGNWNKPSAGLYPSQGENSKMQSTHSSDMSKISPSIYSGNQVNCVVMRGLNEDEIVNFVEKTRNQWVHQRCHKVIRKSFQQHWRSVHWIYAVRREPVEHG